MKPRIKKLYDEVKKKHKESGLTYHGADHIDSVLKHAIKIARYERGVNLDVVRAAAILHDIGRIHPEDNLDHEYVGEKIDRYLGDFSDEEKAKIKECIRATHKDEQPKTIEAKIVVDADYMIFSQDDYFDILKNQFLEQERKTNPNLKYEDIIAGTPDIMRAYFPNGEYHTKHGKRLGNKGLKRNLERAIKEAEKADGK